MGQKLPQGCRAKLVFYFTSDKTGVDIEYTLSNFGFLPDLSTIDPAGLIPRLPDSTDDWRVMTDAEIRAYLDACAADAEVDCAEVEH